MPWWPLGGDGFFDRVADLAFEVFLGWKSRKSLIELGLRDDDYAVVIADDDMARVADDIAAGYRLPTYPGPFLEGPAGTTARAKTARPISFISSMSWTALSSPRWMARCWGVFASRLI